MLTRLGMDCQNWDLIDLLEGIKTISETSTRNNCGGEDCVCCSYRELRYPTMEFTAIW